jgi:hypothetical protein
MVAGIEPGITNCGPIERDPRVVNRNGSADEHVVNTGSRAAIDRRRHQTAGERRRVAKAGLTRRGPKPVRREEFERRLLRDHIQVAREDDGIGWRQVVNETQNRNHLTKARPLPRGAGRMMEVSVRESDGRSGGTLHAERLDDPHVSQPPDLVEEDLRGATDEQGDSVPVPRISGSDRLRGTPYLVPRLRARCPGEGVVLVDRPVDLLERDDIRSERPQLVLDEWPPFAPPVGLRVVEEVERGDAKSDPPFGGAPGRQKIGSAGTQPGRYGS